MSFITSFISVAIASVITAVEVPVITAIKAPVVTSIVPAVKTSVVTSIITAVKAPIVTPIVPAVEAPLITPISSVVSPVVSEASLAPSLTITSRTALLSEAILFFCPGLFFPILKGEHSWRSLHSLLCLLLIGSTFIQHQPFRCLHLFHFLVHFLLLFFCLGAIVSFCLPGLLRHFPDPAASPLSGEVHC